MGQEAKKLFLSGTMVPFRNVPKTSKYLVGAEIYPLENSLDSKQCKNRICEVFPSTREGNTYQVLPRVEISR